MHRVQRARERVCVREWRERAREIMCERQRERASERERERQRERDRERERETREDPCVVVRGFTARCIPTLASLEQGPATSNQK